jgi:nucleotide-binding universal stress UspA family protein
MSDDDRRHLQVVVGIESGAPAGPALALAADEARRRGLPLAVVAVTRSRPDPGPGIEGLRVALRQAQARALADLHQATTFVRERHPDLTVVTFCLGQAEVGPHREPLDGAEILVIGTHDDRHGRQVVDQESTGRILLAAGRCPVLVVPDRSPSVAPAGRPRSIVVGVGGHPADAAVVRAAYAQVREDDEIVLLHAGSPDERARDLLTAHLAGAPRCARASAITVEEETVTALLSFARPASLLVIGGRTGALCGPVRASVSRAVLEVAPGPVLVVPRILDAGPPAAIDGVTIVAAVLEGATS